MAQCQPPTPRAICLNKRVGYRARRWAERRVRRRAGLRSVLRSVLRPALRLALLACCSRGSCGPFFVAWVVGGLAVAVFFFPLFLALWFFGKLFPPFLITLSPRGGLLPSSPGERGGGNTFLGKDCCSVFCQPA